MKLKKYTILLVIAITILFSVTAYADSSWRWISETSTYDVLPFTAVLTLFIETAAINKIPEINKPLRVFLVITAVNLPSFAAHMLFA